MKKNFDFKLILKALKAIGILVFIYILSQLSFSEVAATLKTVQPEFLAMYILSYFLFFALRMERWRLLQRYFSGTGDFWASWKLNTESLVLGFVTPGKVGDIIKVFLLKEYFGVPRTRGLIIYVYERGLDVLMLVAMALLCLSTLVGWESNQFVVTGLVVFLVLFFCKNAILNQIKAWIPFAEQLKVPLAVELQFLFYSCLIFAVQYLQIYLLSRAMNFDVGFFTMASIYAVSTLVALAPVTVMGLGLREGAFVVLLREHRVTAESATLFSLLDAIVFTAVFIILLNLINHFLLRKTDARLKQQMLQAKLDAGPQ